MEEHQEAGEAREEEEVTVERCKSGSGFWVLGFWGLVLGSGFMVPGAQAQKPEARRMLSCDGPLSPAMTPESLAAAFGQDNVTSEDVDVGEGMTEPGTVLFSKSPADRLDILWLYKGQRTARLAFLRGEKSRWRTAAGLTLGVSLRSIERMNRRPFRLLGFGWDYAGTTMSWSGGLLEEPASSPCRVRARLSPRDPSSDPTAGVWYGQVRGDREFSSGHPAMQTLNPVVYEILVQYGP